MNDQQYQLLVNIGPEPGKIYDLTSVSMTIGRDPMAEITINDPEVSRRHAQLIGTISGYRIQDLGSTNGTFVDGIRLGGEPRDLEAGQVISIGGGLALVYQIADSGDYQADTLLDASMASLAAQELLDNRSDVSLESADDSDLSPLTGSEIDAADDTGLDPYAEDERYAPPIIASPSSETNVEPPQQVGIPPLYAAEPELEEGQDFSEPVIIPHQGEPVEPSAVTKSSKNRRLNTIIAALVLVLICCCCSFILFLYYYGGDWMLRQMGLMP